VITLITGTPGAGKTLYAVNLIVNELLPQRRQIFANINGLRIPQVWDCGASGPHKWQDYPDGTIFVFDEVQHQWPSERGVRDVPESVKALDTHRHRGMDFYLITQAPMGLDPRVRRLIGRHIHLHRAMGMKYARVMDWPCLMDDPRPPTAYDDGARHFFKYPKKLFELYQSASLHTAKPRFPWQLMGPVALFLAICGVILWNAPTAIETFRAANPPEDEETASSDQASCFPIIAASPLTVRSSSGLHTLTPENVEQLRGFRDGNRLCFPS
jgi:zona occludens toxin